MIDNGADVNKKGNQNAELNIENKKKYSIPLIIAYKYRNESVVKYLINHGTNTNEVTDDNNTALMAACRYNEENKNKIL